MTRRASKPVVGIIGGIGSGKSTVARMFERLGAVVLCGDVVGHEVLRRHDVRQRIRMRWGDRVFDATGSVDRAALARIVFADRAELDALNAITHPLIGAELQRRVEQALGRNDATAVVIDAALLIEAGWDRMCDALLYVHATPEQRRRRVRQARGWDPHQWKQRENSQESLELKRARADDEIDNSGSPEETFRQVQRLFSVLTADTPHA